MKTGKSICDIQIGKRRQRGDDIARVGPVCLFNLHVVPSQYVSLYMYLIIQISSSLLYFCFWLVLFKYLNIEQVNSINHLRTRFRIREHYLQTHQCKVHPHRSFNSSVSDVAVVLHTWAKCAHLFPLCNSRCVRGTSMSLALATSRRIVVCLFVLDAFVVRILSRKQDKLS